MDEIYSLMTSKEVGKALVTILARSGGAIRFLLLGRRRRFAVLGGAVGDNFV